MKYSEINHPDYYRAYTGIEAINVIDAWDLNFNLGNAIKYIARAGLKDNSDDDLKKAIWYLQHELYLRGYDNATEN